MGYDADGWSIQENTPKNSNLTKAKAAKNDEFYTQYCDIDAELSHYDIKHFADRVVYLPCDDWHFSQFVKYFEDNFTRLQLKALVATGINFNSNGYYYKKTSEGVTTGVLDCNGDFRSDACRQLMREADIIVTNPPFSLFREFVAQIMEFEKDFIVWGRKDCINYADFGSHFIKGEVFLGFTYASHSKFVVPGGGLKEVGTVTYTNLETHLKPKPCTLTCSYSHKEYQKYTHYDAINVDSADEIPNDYFKPIGVPVTFLKYLSPEQFDLLDARQFATSEKLKKKSEIIISHELINGKPCYARLLIKRKTIPVEAE